MKVIEYLSLLSEIVRGLNPNILPTQLAELSESLETLSKDLSELSPEQLDAISPKLIDILKRYKVQAVVSTDGSCSGQGSPTESTDGSCSVQGSPTESTDGSCSVQGNPNPVAGFGVYWGKDHPNNLKGSVTDIPDSSRAELFAAQQAINQAIDQGYYSIKIRHDSQFVKEVIERPTDFEKKKNQNHLDLILLIKEANSKIHTSVELIKSHSGDVGNQKADYLAKDLLRFS